MTHRWLSVIILVLLAGCTAPDSGPPSPTPASMPELDMNFNCWAAYFVPVQGLVIDTGSGAPVEGATITIESYDREAMRIYTCPKIESPLVTITDHDGSFYFPEVVMDGHQVEGTTTRIEVSKSGCARHEELIPVDVSAGISSAVEVVLYIRC